MPPADRACRSTRSSRPPATRASVVCSCSDEPGAREATSSRTVFSLSRRNGTSWHREGIVSGNGPRSSATSTITAYGGGSSRSLRSASAASSFSEWAPKIEIDPAIGFERPHVEVVAQLANLVDADLVAERLDDVEIWVGEPLDAALVAQQFAGEAQGGAPLSHSRRAVEEVRVRRPFVERGRRAADCVCLLRKALERDLAPPSLSLPAAARRRARPPAPGRSTPAHGRRSRPPAGTRHPRARCGPGPRPRWAASSASIVSRKVRSGRMPRIAFTFRVEHLVDAEAAGDALVRERRVEVAVADDVGAALERRPDDLRDQLGPRSREQRRLRPGRDLRPLARAGGGRAPRAPSRRAPEWRPRRDPPPRGETAATRPGSTCPTRRVPRTSRTFAPRIGGLESAGHRGSGVHRVTRRGGPAGARRRGDDPRRPLGRQARERARGCPARGGGHQETRQRSSRKRSRSSASTSPRRRTYGSRSRGPTTTPSST